MEGHVVTAPADVQARITEQQLAMGPQPVTPRTRADLRRRARWWELEAQREYQSAGRSREYAENMRWLVEMLDNGVRVFGRRFDEVCRNAARSLTKADGERLGR
jgi:hypothetical protein